MYKILALCLMVIFLTGCESLRDVEEYVQSRTKPVNVHKGAPKEKVLEVMGRPDEEQISGNEELWKYCRDDFSGSPNQFAAVWYEDNKVRRVKRYRDTTYNDCDSFFKSVKLIE